MGRKNREQGDDEEKMVAHLAMMSIQPGSGCGPIDKEDLICPFHFGQVKSTRTEKVSVSIKDLRVLEGRAREKKKKMVFFVSFVGPKVDDRYALIPLEEWIRTNR
jgi:hypothetical protein